MGEIGAGLKQKPGVAVAVTNLDHETRSLLTRACQAEALSEALVGALDLYLRRAWKNPGFGGFEGV